MKTRAPNTTATGEMACANGEPWLGPHPICQQQVEAAYAQFTDDVLTGIFDADGFTPLERAAQLRRLRDVGRLF